MARCDVARAVVSKKRPQTGGLMMVNTKDDKSTASKMTIFVISPYIDELIRMYVRDNNLTLKDFFEAAIDCFEIIKGKITSFQRGASIYYAPNKNIYSVKLSASIDEHQKNKIDKWSNEDGVDLRIVCYNAAIQYINHLEEQGILSKYKEALQHLGITEQR
jgi:hypothetical protein